MCLLADCLLVPIFIFGGQSLLEEKFEENTNNLRGFFNYILRIRWLVVVKSLH